MINCYLSVSKLVVVFDGATHDVPDGQRRIDGLLAGRRFDKVGAGEHWYHGRFVYLMQLQLHNIIVHIIYCLIVYNATLNTIKLHTANNITRLETYSKVNRLYRRSHVKLTKQAPNGYIINCFTVLINMWIIITINLICYW